MTEEPVVFEDTMYSVEANLIVMRASAALLASGLPVNRSSVEEYMRRYLSGNLVDKYITEIQLILDDMTDSMKDMDKGFIWEAS